MAHAQGNEFNTGMLGEEIHDTFYNMHNAENQMASTSICHSNSCFNTIVKNQCGQKLLNYCKLTTSHELMSRVLGTSVPNPILDCLEG